MTSIFLQSTQAVGEFLLGAVHDTLDLTAAGISAIPGQVANTTKYVLGVDHYVGEGRPWFKLGTGFTGSFWAGDNGLTRLADRFNTTLLTVGLAAVNTVGFGKPYELVNQKMGIDCPYFFPGPTTARDMGRFFSSGLAMMLMGHRVLAAPKVMPASSLPVVAEAPPPLFQGKFRPTYIEPSVFQELAHRIRGGSALAPAYLRRMLDSRTPQIVAPAARTAVELIREGYLPTHLLENLLWDTHPRTVYLFQYMHEMRAGSPLLRAIWNHLRLDSYEVEILSNGDSHLRPISMPLHQGQPRSATAAMSAVHYN